MIWIQKVQYRSMVINELKTTYRINKTKARKAFKASTINKSLNRDPSMQIHDSVECMAKIIYEQICNGEMRGGRM